MTNLHFQIHYFLLTLILSWFRLLRTTIERMTTKLYQPAEAISRRQSNYSFGMTSCWANFLHHEFQNSSLSCWFTFYDEISKFDLIRLVAKNKLCLPRNTIFECRTFPRNLNRSFMQKITSQEIMIVKILFWKWSISTIIIVYILRYRCL